MGFNDLGNDWQHSLVLATGSADGSIHVFDLSKGQVSFSSTVWPGGDAVNFCRCQGGHALVLDIFGGADCDTNPYFGKIPAMQNRQSRAVPGLEKRRRLVPCQLQAFNLTTPPFSSLLRPPATQRLWTGGVHTTSRLPYPPPTPPNSPQWTDR